MKENLAWEKPSNSLTNEDTIHSGNLSPEVLKDIMGISPKQYAIKQFLLFIGLEFFLIVIYFVTMFSLSFIALFVMLGIMLFPFFALYDVWRIARAQKKYISVFKRVTKGDIVVKEYVRNSYFISRFEFLFLSTNGIIYTPKWSVDISKVRKVKAHLDGCGVITFYPYSKHEEPLEVHTQRKYLDEAYGDVCNFLDME
ncbi:MAG: hypothetical protein ACNI27_01800 [Desulfovibrio sp.]